MEIRKQKGKQLGKNTIWKSRGKTKEQTHTGQDTIQA